MGVASWYLALYNATQAAAWSYVLGASCHALLLSPPVPSDAVYSAASGVVSLCQTASLLETAHALLGLTRSGALGNALQWAGRTHCWWLVVALPELRASAAVVVLILCWALADVIRYAWASLSTLGVCPRALTALRYTAFVPLYPLGAGAEVLLMALALPASRAGFRCVTMPNAWNFGFDNAGFLFAVLLAYPPVWAVLYKHMWRQRARKLGGAVSEADKKAA